MKPLLIFLFFTFFASSLFAQKDKAFDTTGVYIYGNKSQAKDTTIVDTININQKQLKEIKKQLAQQVQVALNVMEDDSLHWKQMYLTLWGATTVDSIKRELRSFKNYLLHNTDTLGYSPNYKFVPYPKSLVDSLGKIFIYSNYRDLSNYESAKIVHTNPFKLFLLQWLNNTINSDVVINQLNMDMDYINAWRQLEAAFAANKDAMTEINKLIGKCVITTCADDTYKKIISKTQNLLNINPPITNTVVKLANSNFYKKWLWFTQGQLLINPLLATTPDRRYPATEKLSQLKEEDKKPLLKAIAEDSLLTIMLTTQKVKNEAIEPKNSGNNKIEFCRYNAASNYKPLSPNALPKYKDDKKQLGIIIYNVPAKEKLTFNIDKSITIADKSTAIIALESALDNSSLTSIFNNSAAILSGFQKLGLNGVSSSNSTPVINSLDNTGFSTSASVKLLTGGNVEKKTFKANKFDGSKTVLQNLFSANYDGIENGNKNYSDSISQKIIKDRIVELEGLKNKTVQQTEFKVTINGREMLATKKSDIDKLIFILASYNRKKNDKCSGCDEFGEVCLVEEFIKKDACYELKYESKKTLQDSTNALLKRFACFFVEVKKCRTLLLNKRDELTKLNDTLLQYLNITQRSLPPVLTAKTTGNRFEEEILDSIPALRTVIFAPEMPTPPKKIVYEVTSNTFSKVDNKWVQSDSNLVIKHSYKYAKRHWIDFSVGLAYTAGDYLVKSNSGNSLPQISEADRFKPIAGLHIYPAGLLKIDDRINNKKIYDRLSIFLGLSVKKALENIYPAISYDIVPGIRIMGGVHFYKDTKYTIVNNAVVDQASALKSSGAFISLNLEPTTIVKLVGLIK
jgi:hypothetical protein